MKRLLFTDCIAKTEATLSRAFRAANKTLLVNVCQGKRSYGVTSAEFLLRHYRFWGQSLSSRILTCSNRSSRSVVVFVPLTTHRSVRASIFYRCVVKLLAISTSGKNVPVTLPTVCCLHIGVKYFCLFKSKDI